MHQLTGGNTYFSESLFGADGVDDHSVANARHHGQHVESNAHSHSDGQFTVDDIQEGNVADIFICSFT